MLQISQVEKWLQVAPKEFYPKFNGQNYFS